MTKIFISYRREDSEDIAGRIYDRLKEHFGVESVFFDIDTIPLGIDFEEYIDASVSQCQVFLAIIGKSWLTVADGDGNRRLDLESDFVRLEIESALSRKVPVIPLLVRHALMPPKSQLPESIRKLASRNGAQVRSGKDFHKDVDELINGIEAHFRADVSPTFLSTSSKQKLDGYLLNKPYRTASYRLSQEGLMLLRRAYISLGYKENGLYSTLSSDILLSRQTISRVFNRRPAQRKSLEKVLAHVNGLLEHNQILYDYRWLDPEDWIEIYPK